MLQQTEIDGVRIAYQETGSGRPLILIHGVGAAQEIWDKNRDELSKHFRVITPDLPGCGRSAKPLRFDYSLLSLAAVMEKFVLSFSVLGEKVIVGGNSLGGGLALVMAPRIQEKISHLLLLGTVCYPQEMPWGFQLLRRRGVGELAMLLTPAKLIAGMVLKEALCDDSLATPEAVRLFARPARSPFWRWAQIQTIRRILPGSDAVTALTGSYRKIHVPTLIVWGKEDSITPLELSSRLSGDLPRACLETLDRCGHIPQFESPEKVNRLILDFLQRRG